jgi:hypothetical protein
MNEMDRRKDTNATQGFCSGSLSVFHGRSEDGCENEWPGPSDCSGCTRRKRGNLMIGIYALVVMAVLFGLLFGMVMSGLVAEWGSENGLVKTNQGETHERENNTD